MGRSLDVFVDALAARKGVFRLREKLQEVRDARFEEVPGVG